jgi:DNA-binding NtrC family response regulator
LLNSAPVLVAEDEPFIALDIAFAIEDAGGEVIGPAASVEQALALIEARSISGAILDVNLTDGDITPVAEAVLRLGIPIILQSGIGLPPEFAARFPEVVFHMKPCVSATLVAELAQLILHRQGAVPPEKSRSAS